MHEHQKRITKGPDQPEAKKREISARRHGAVMALKWRDKRDVLVLPTKHTPAMQVVQ